MTYFKQNYYNKSKRFSKDEQQEYRRMQKEKAEKVLDEIFEKFKTEEFPEFVAKEYLKPIDRPSDRWSLSNRFAMWISGTLDARGFRQWEAIKRTVNKGSKAVYILAPNKYIIKQNKTKIDEATNKIIKIEEEIPVVFFKPIPVFRVEDTEGEPVKYVEEPKTILPLQHIFDKFDLKIEYDRTLLGEYGSCSTDDSKKIRICTPNVMTAFHELVHAVHGSIEPLKNGQDPEQEIIAQLTALILGKIYGFEASEDMAYSYRYIESYTKNVNGDRHKIVHSCIKVIGKIEKILDKIFDIEKQKYKQEEE